MHIAFIPYGVSSEIEKFKACLESQAMKLPMTKGKKVQDQWIFGAVREIGPVWEYIIPKEYKDIVLTSLRFHKQAPYLSWLKVALIRKGMSYKKVKGEFDTSQQFIWKMDNVSIIPIGIREDGVLKYDEGPLKGWEHEAL